jgi:quercetin dioxygenase-like cupin family protein
VLPPADGIMINNVFFEPGARTHWHTHGLAQVLHVTAGLGLLVSHDGTVEELRPGDTAHIPAGVRHWHGAAPGSYLVHLAISINGTDWLEAVSDDDYARATGV